MNARVAEAPVAAQVRSSGWAAVCELADLWPSVGVCALVNGRQIAIFRIGDALYALDTASRGAVVSHSQGRQGLYLEERVLTSNLPTHPLPYLSAGCSELHLHCSSPHVLHCSARNQQWLISWNLQ